MKDKTGEWRGIFGCHLRVSLAGLGGFAMAAVIFLLSPVGAMGQCNDGLSTGLVSWYRAEGNAMDTVGTNNGTANGNLGYTSGKDGQGFYFDGASSYIRVPVSSSTDVGSGGGFTVECWIVPASVTDQLPIVNWDDDSFGLGMQFFTSGYYGAANIGGPGCLYANFRDVNINDHVIASPTNLINNTSFQHVAVTYDQASGVAAIYYNGAQVASQVLGHFIPQTTTPMNIGARFYQGSSIFFSGSMDEFGLYNRALSAAEIQLLYQQGGARDVCVVPQLLNQPQAATVTPGGSNTFSASAYGSLPMSFQWLKNGAPLAGATKNTLTLTNIQTTDAGAYSVQVSNAQSISTSANAALNVTVVTVFGNGLKLVDPQYSFSGSATFQLQNFYSGGYIFYTLDGSEPGPFSLTYSAPFKITNNVIIRAVGYSPDFSQSGTVGPIAITFVPIYTLTTIAGGGGKIVVTNSSYLSNTLAGVTAVPSNGWVFLEWLGDLSGLSASNSVLMTRNKSIQAVFGTTLGNTAAGGGSVQFDPPGGIYPYGAVVQASAIPNAGKVFAIWGNAASGTNSPLSFVVNTSNAVISALFSSPQTGKVGLAVVPVGEGRVTKSLSNAVYNVNQVVTLTATPNTGKKFLGWSGDATGTNNPLAVTLNTSKTIYATFSLNDTVSLAFGAGNGPGGGVAVNLNGEIGTHYRLDYSTNLVTWLPLFDTTNTTGTIHYLDTNAPNLSRCFYRSVILP